MSSTCVRAFTSGRSSAPVPCRSPRSSDAPSGATSAVVNAQATPVSLLCFAPSLAVHLPLPMPLSALTDNRAASVSTRSPQGSRDSETTTPFARPNPWRHHTSSAPGLDHSRCPHLDGCVTLTLPSNPWLAHRYGPRPSSPLWTLSTTARKSGGFRGLRRPCMFSIQRMEVIGSSQPPLRTWWLKTPSRVLGFGPLRLRRWTA